MQFTWHLAIIIGAILIGVCMFQKGEKTPNMSDEQLKEAEMYRNYSYLLFAIAAAVAIYYYFSNAQQKASMCGGGHYKGYMHGGCLHGKATMCGKPHY